MDAEEVLALRWPDGEGVPLVADVIRKLASHSVNITLDVKLPVGCPFLSTSFFTH
jgi:hypothetical protein